MANEPDLSERRGSLGRHLAALRAAAGLSLRQVEDATGKEVSNAYLSQLENDKINKPSPNILHALSLVYSSPYEDLMERAGYLPTVPTANSVRRHAKAATFAIENLTPEEEEALIAYLGFIRQQRKK